MLTGTWVASSHQSGGIVVEVLRQLFDPVAPWQQASRYGSRGIGYALGINLLQVAGVMALIRGLFLLLGSLV